MECNKVTINDVAKAAGVSKGTVDRVLHNRGEVSAKSKEKVLKVIEELGFKPNLYASLLASQKERVIDCVIPEHLPGEFWSLASKVISDAASVVSRYGIRVRTVGYDQYSLESFRAACASVLESNPSGVIPEYGTVNMARIESIAPNATVKVDYTFTATSDLTANELYFTATVAGGCLPSSFRVPKTRSLCR